MAAPAWAAKARRRWLGVMTLPYLAAVTVGLGLVLAVSMPLPGSSDYGQWLITTRPYLGQAIPDYRDFSNLPPLVPVSLALVRLVVGDPVVSLRVFDLMLLVGLTAGFAAVGWTLFRSREAAVAAVLLAMLVTDRFQELFAFGGLLQISATIFALLAVAAFLEASRGPVSTAHRWWWVGSICLGLVGVSHVGTAVIVVPIGVLIAALALLRRWQRDRTTSLRSLAPLVLVLLPLAAWWVTVIVPANQLLANNPASLNYRGPELLAGRLGSPWPRGAIIVVAGFLSIAWGLFRELKRRSVGRYAVLAAWTLAGWGALLGAVIVGAGTDYPRFDSILIAPLIIGAAGASAWLSRWLMRRIRIGYRLAGREVAMVFLVFVAILATPSAIDRFSQQYTFYGVPDGESLVRAVSRLDRILETRDVTVLAPARGATWLEGLTGRPALFNNLVRYQFRPGEWQRSVDAEVLEHATLALTNEFFLVEYTGRVNGRGVEAPVDLVIAANHGGEFVDLLTLAHDDTSLGPPTSTPLTSLSAERVTSTHDDSEAAIGTEWRGSGSTASITFARTVRLARGNPTLSLTDETPSGATQSVLHAAPGIVLTSVETSANQAHVCFSRRGNSVPCLDLRMTNQEARIEATDQGGLRLVASGDGPSELLITDLTAGDAFVGLGLLDPRELVTKHNVGAAIVIAYGPSYAMTLSRLTPLGFRLSFVEGIYAVLVRDASPS
jgi:hypothetical protein